MLAFFNTVKGLMFTARTLLCSFRRMLYFNPFLLVRPLKGRR